MDQSPRLDPYRHKGTGRQGNQLDDRSRHSEHAVQARLHEGFAGERNRDPGRRVSVQGWVESSKRQGCHFSRRAKAISRLVRHRRSVRAEEVIGFCEWLAQTPWSIALHESAWGYPLVESVHVLALCLFLGMAVMLDLR